ncbi:hypothetical protein AS593_20245 [Caulobacter vibrioides]|nr:hypothetical protein AS593_20245 [Caulobacter vibrioides]
MRRAGRSATWWIGVLAALGPAAALAAEASLTLKAAKELTPAEILARAFAMAVGEAPSARIEDGLPYDRALQQVRTLVAPRRISDRVCRGQNLSFLFRPASPGEARVFSDPPSVVDRLEVSNYYLTVPLGRSDCAGGAGVFKASSEAVAARAVHRLEALLAAPEGWRFSCVQPGCDLSKVRIEDLRDVGGVEDGELSLGGEMAGRVGWRISLSGQDDVATLWTGPIAPN